MCSARTRLLSSRAAGVVSVVCGSLLLGALWLEVLSLARTFLGEQVGWCGGGNLGAYHCVLGALTRSFSDTVLLGVELLCRLLRCGVASFCCPSTLSTLVGVACVAGSWLVTILLLAVRSHLALSLLCL